MSLVLVDDMSVGWQKNSYVLALLTEYRMDKECSGDRL